MIFYKNVGGTYVTFNFHRVMQNKKMIVSDIFVTFHRYDELRNIVHNCLLGDRIHADLFPDKVEYHEPTSWRPLGWYEVKKLDDDEREIWKERCQQTIDEWFEKRDIDNRFIPNAVSNVTEPKLSLSKGLFFSVSFDKKFKKLKTGKSSLRKESMSWGYPKGTIMRKMIDKIWDEYEDEIAYQILCQL